MPARPGTEAMLVSLDRTAVEQSFLSSKIGEMESVEGRGGEESVSDGFLDRWRG